MGAPNPPSQIKINGDPEIADMATKAMGDVTIKAKVTDTDGGRVRLVVRYQRVDLDGTEGVVHEARSDRVGSGDVATLHLKRLGNNCRYEAKCFTADTEGKISHDYNGISWWMNRKAVTNAVSPADNAMHDPDLDLDFDWGYSDPDGGLFQQDNWELRWRRAADPERLAGEWVTRKGGSDTTAKTIDAGTFSENVTYEWQARGKDEKGLWAEWSILRSFTTTGHGYPPRLDYPINGEAIVTSEANTFRWRFKDPDRDDFQVKADVRYRAVGADLWTTLPGDTTTPGSQPWWVMPANTFTVGTLYEWSVRTYDDSSGGSTPSSWADPVPFAVVPSTNPLPIIDYDADTPVTLGCGTHVAYIYDRGGLVRRGIVTPLTLTRWTRVRDDIGSATVATNGFGADCGRLLERVRCWMHELVIYRVLPDHTMTRVFEGPITRLTYKRNNVEIEAKDVMAYPYRRIMRQGYNDGYRRIKVHGGPDVQLGLLPVVIRAGKVLQNALSYEDPNVLQFLTVLHAPADARQSRIVPDYSRTAWEELDDLAANAGLDYSVIGRRIILWDTHQAIGTLPEMTDKNFGDSLIVSEYGMLTANHFGVTDGTGVYGVAKPVGTTWSNAPVDGQVGQFDYYGPVEMLASSYGDSAENKTNETLEQRDARQRRAATYAEQAQRNISDRWPTPLVVRLPDNTEMSPDTPVGINHLVPGVWIPLRAERTLRKVAGWQKLDRVEVEEAGGKEQVRVTMSPAPNGGNDDPDAEGADVVE